jgi:hypothetical protein
VDLLEVMENLQLVLQLLLLLVLNQMLRVLLDTQIKVGPWGVYFKLDPEVVVLEQLEEMRLYGEFLVLVETEDLFQFQVQQSLTPEEVVALDLMVQVEVQVAQVEEEEVLAPHLQQLQELQTQAVVAEVMEEVVDLA